jgi:hypothetical protein
MGNAETQEAHAAAALFQRFETVFQSKTSLLAAAGPRDFVRVPFAFLLGSLEALDKRAPGEVLDNAEAVFVGSKDYTPPKAGLGMVRSMFCYIVVLRDKNELDIGRHFKRPISSAFGGPVWHWSASLNEFGEDDPRPSSLYAVQIAQSYLLVSNNLKDLEYVAGGLRSSKANDSRVLARNPEWDEISEHKFWGYRRYRQGKVPNKFDPTTAKISPTTDALAVFADSSEGSGTLRLIGSSSDDKTAESLNATRDMAPFIPHSPGVWQATVPLSGDDKEQYDRETIFFMRWLFGYGSIV